MIEEYLEKEPKSGDDLYQYWQELIATTWTFVHENYHDKWERYMRMYRGNHWDVYADKDFAYKSSRQPADEITVNLIGPYINQLKSFVFTNPARIHVNPTNPEEVTSAILQEYACNYEWRRRDYNSEIKRAFSRASILGHGILKQGYMVELDESANPRQDGTLDYRDFVKKDAPILRNVSPFCFLYDLSAPERNLETARWCCEIIHQHPQYVLTNKRYNSRVQADIRTGKEKPEPLTDTYPGSIGTDMPDSMKNLFTEYHVLDKQYGKKYIFLKGCTRPLFEGPWDFDYLDGFGYYMLPFIENPHDWYPIGMVEWIEDPQLELNRTRTALFHFRRREVGGQYQIEDTVEKPERENFLNGGKITVIPQGSRGVEPIKTAQIASEQLLVEQRIQNDLDRISGISDVMQGIASPGRRSATQDRNRSQFSMLRIEGIVSEVDRIVVQVASDLIKHIKANYVTERIAEIAGPLAEYWGRVTGEPPGPDGKYWRPYTMNDIQGEFDIEIETTARPTQDPQQLQANKERYAAFLMDRIVAPALQGIPIDQPQYTGGVSMLEVARWLGEGLGLRPILPRLLPALRVLPPPIQTQTAFAAQGAAPSTPAPAPEQMPVQEGQMMREAVNPISELMGAQMGGNNQQ